MAIFRQKMDFLRLKKRLKKPKKSQKIRWNLPVEFTTLFSFFKKHQKFSQIFNFSKIKNFQLFKKHGKIPPVNSTVFGLKMTNFGGIFHEKGGKLSQNINIFINSPYNFHIFFRFFVKICGVFMII